MRLFRDKDIGTTAPFIIGAMVSVSGRISKFGSRPAHNAAGEKNTILLTDVRIGQFHFDHLWISRPKRTEKILMEIGDLLELTAIGRSYEKSDVSRSIGLKKIRVVKLTKGSDEPLAEPPKFSPT